jgi:Flp pilus assembly pilin Flp
MITLVRALDTLQAYAQTRLRDERGAVTIEYGVLAVFIALALIAVVGVLVGGIDTWFGNIATFISGQPGG